MHIIYIIYIYVYMYIDDRQGKHIYYTPELTQILLHAKKYVRQTQIC